MILIKDGIERVLNNKETIRIFKDAGWEEKIIEDGTLEHPYKTILPEPIEEKPKSKKTTKKNK